MSLFLKQIADKFAGQVAFSLPDCNGGYVNIAAFLSEDPIIKMGNKWEPLIPDIDKINDFMQLANQSAISWVSTSKVGWKGTEPITVTFNFYLITYLKSQVDGSASGKVLPVSKQAAYFAQLAAVKNSDTGNDKGDTGTVSYSKYNSNVVNNFNIMALKDLNQGGWSVASDSNGGIYNEGDAAYTCEIVVNGNGHSSLFFKKMLLESVEFTPSTVRAGYWNERKSDALSNIKVIGNGSFVTSSEPLYIKVSASFRLMHTATVADAVRLFTGGTSL